MAVQYYARKDIPPLVVSIVSMTMFYLTHVSFKVAIEKEFPDLEGLISTDILDGSTLEMLETMEENEWSNLVSSCIWSIKESISKLADHYGLDWREEFNKELPVDLSTDFLLKIGFYDKSNHYENHWKELERVTRFSSYVYYLLCRLLLFEEVDFNSYREDDHTNSTLPYLEDLVRMEGKEEYDVAILGMLGLDMLNYYIKLVALENRSS
jgi:hypothetical protein